MFYDSKSHFWNFDSRPNVGIDIYIQICYTTTQEREVVLMEYSEERKQSSMKYIREKQKSILVRFKRTQYEEEIEPAIIKSGLQVTTFIKNAIMEKIERDGLNQ